VDIYKDDANLSELTCGATECVYDFKNQLKNLRFAKFLGVDSIPIPTTEPETPPEDEPIAGADGDAPTEPTATFSAASFVRKTGGLFRPLKNLQDVINDPVKLLQYVNMDGPAKFSAERIKYAPPEDEGEGGADEEGEGTTAEGNPDGAIYGAEPISPGRIQFSSLSIESMYFASEIKEEESFEHLYRTLTADGQGGFLNGSGIFSDGSVSARYRDYAKFLIYPDKQIANIQGITTLDSLNKYNILALDLDIAYSLNNSSLSFAILRRHEPPIGSLFGFGLSIAPVIGDDGRTPAMPVLTCKSTIKTAAQSLFFTCDQSIGVIQKRTVSGGQGPTVTIFPIGGGIGWSTPGNPVQTWDFVQWGGGNDIDSFGTTALHVRVFEHVPPNQLIYLGPLFTPLHFNPSEPLNKFVLAYDASNNPIASGTNEPNPLATDFRVPTSFGGKVYKVNDPVTLTQSTEGEGEEESSDGLAPFDFWKRNSIRRGKMTTKGGFAYFKPVIVAASATITDGGMGYKKDEKLILLDGSEILITEVEDEEAEEGEEGKKGIIKNIEFKPNFDGNIVKTQTNGFRSIENVSANGGSGTGAKFNFSFVIKYDIGYDPAPKESTPAKGLLISSPNARGELGHITNQSNVSVELISSSNNSTYDIFYFYHNDPSHYSLQDTMPFSNGSAQYIISEVKAQ
jgi:hypothetical protein